MTTLIIPIGGTGSRFSEAGYTKPKPLIEIQGEPMIIKALRSIDLPVSRTLLAVRRFEGYKDLIQAVNNYDPAIEIYEFDTVTSGPAITVRDAIYRYGVPDSTPIFTANCDQIMRWNGTKFYEFCLGSVISARPRGVVVTFEGGDTRHSFVSLDSKGIPVEFREKKKISNIALSGIHYWESAELYNGCVDDMILAKDTAPNGEFYIAPAYNYILDKSGIYIYHIPKSTFCPVGTPDELDAYNANL